jgi:hypothetical protein
MWRDAVFSWIPGKQLMWQLNRCLIPLSRLTRTGCDPPDQGGSGLVAAFHFQDDAINTGDPDSGPGG